VESILQSTGIPFDGLIVIIEIDWISGMFMTSVNETEDLTASLIFNKFYGLGLCNKSVPKENQFVITLTA
jgi:Na+/H+-dicarboxylate symporter